MLQKVQKRIAVKNLKRQRMSNKNDEILLFNEEKYWLKMALSLNPVINFVPFVTDFDTPALWGSNLQKTNFHIVFQRCPVWETWSGSFVCAHHLLTCSRFLPLQGGPRCAAVGSGWRPGSRSWAQGGWAGTRTPLWNSRFPSPGPVAAPSRTEPARTQNHRHQRHKDKRLKVNIWNQFKFVWTLQNHIGPTFLCTSVRIRYSAERSKLALRLGRTNGVNGSGENLREQKTETV